MIRNKRDSATLKIRRILGIDLQQATEMKRKDLCSWARTPVKERNPMVCPYRQRLGLSGQKALCNKTQAVCSLSPEHRKTETDEEIAICPSRLLSDTLIHTFPMALNLRGPLRIATEVSVQSQSGGKAFQIDVALRDVHGTDIAIEIQSVYTSGGGLGENLKETEEDADKRIAVDWRSSGAKRLMPQVDAEWNILQKAGKRLCILAQPNLFSMLPKGLPRLSRLGDAEFQNCLKPETILVVLVEKTHVADPIGALDHAEFVAASYENVRRALMAGSDTTLELVQQGFDAAFEDSKA
jgi:hypothetical protein